MLFRPHYLLLLCVLGGCASEPRVKSPEPARSVSPVTAQPAARQSVGSRAARVAREQLGRPYVYGAKGPQAFDCSGLVYYSYQQSGLHAPRTTSALWERAVPVSRQSLRAGDILFFRIEGKMSHVGIYLGGGRFVHAPSSGKRMSVQTLASDFYRRAFIRGGRLPGAG
jgi:cell wall-associated NlpC family hydrolase